MTASVKRTVWWIVGLLAIAGIGSFFFLRGGQEDPAAAAAQAIADADDQVTVFIGDLASSATASGQVSAADRASLSAGSGIVTAVLVRVGDNVAAGDVLVELDVADLELNVATAEQTLAIREADLANLQEPASAAQVTAAQASVASAQANLDDLLGGPSTEEIAEKEADIRAAQASIFSASASLQGTLETITEADIEAARAELVNAEFQLEQAQNINETIAVESTHNALLDAQEAVEVARAKYNNLLNGVSPNSVYANQSEIASAAAQRDNSQVALDELLLGATDAQIASAIAQLKQAEADLASLLEGPTSQEILIAEAAVEQAKLALADAQESLEDARLVAPFDGIITAVSVSEGEMASGTIVEMIDPNTFEVVLSVDEVDIGQVELGQEANIVLESWPNINIPSTVQAVAPSATNDNSGLVSYDVHLRLGETSLPIRVGMTADAGLITERRTDVLLVANTAIRADRSDGTFFVNIIEGNNVEEVEIKIGLRDDTYTQVVSGLDEGDEILVNYRPPTNTFGPGGGPFGGGDEDEEESEE